MKTTRKKAPGLTPETIDASVVAQSEDPSAWEAPVAVRRSKAASLSIPGDLAARAAFLARLHHEPGVDQWVERIVRERVELEESAFNQAKKTLASRMDRQVRASNRIAPAMRQPVHLTG